jgi:hypothetical protein
VGIWPLPIEDRLPITPPAVRQLILFFSSMQPGRKWWTTNAVDAKSMPPQQQPDEGETK